MKIICKKSDLLNSVNIVLKAVPSKSTMPILECIVVEVKNNQIQLIANDMELAIKTIVKGDILEEGVIAINAKLFSEMMRRISDNNDAMVTIETDANHTVFINCEKLNYNIAGKDDSEFPSIPVVEKDKSISLSQFSLKEIIRQTVFSISDNESNKIMTGELFEINGDEFKVVSLDGHRISIRKIKLKEAYDSIKVVVPGKTLNEISKILSGGMEDEVNIFFTNKHIVFEFDDTVVLSRLIEGEYYKIDQMLSSDYETKITVNKRKFISSIDHATLLIRESDKKPIIIHITDDNMEIKINSSNGSLKEEVDIAKEGKDILIGFNPKFLTDALRVIDEEEVDIYLFNPKAPCFIRDKEESYIYLILPVNFNAGVN